MTEITDGNELELPGTGMFLQTLTRNNSQIRRDRAESIYQDTKLVFRRRVEDLQITLTRLIRQRDAMLDLSPSDSHSLVPAAKDFDPVAFTDADIKLGIEIRNTEIMMEIAKERYEKLFGPLPQTA